jgi:peptidoglycan/LPS O-acetylase OafA/YrhL
MARLSFRRDINGLRAYAVIAVVLFHFGVPGFSGGFVGVDVFFVISGFLMTAILAGDLQSGQFSIVRFYAMRAKRLVPALVVLCLALTAVGWFVLSPMEYAAHTRNTLGALLFISNFMFWKESGYFDAAAHEKFLLHTWSLSVEWQFYVVFPLLLAALWKFRPGRGALAAGIAASLCLSLALSIIITPFKLTPAFYLLPTRAWELLAGGLVFLLGGVSNFRRGAARAVELCGFALIFAATFLFDSSTLWPSWRAVVPVLGTCLVLAAANQESVWTRTSMAQWLGTISYSLYLWHWPLRVLLGFYDLDSSTVAILAALAATIVLAYGSWRYVETGLVRWITASSPRLVAAGTAIIFLISLAIPAAIAMADGVPTRFSPATQAVFAAASQKSTRASCSANLSHHCSLTYRDFKSAPHPDRIGAIVTGDSHAAVMLHAIEQAMPDRRSEVLFFNHYACPTIAGIKEVFDNENSCGRTVDAALATAASLPPDVPVIIINRTSYYLHGFNESKGVQAPIYYRTKPFYTRDQAYLKEIQDGIVETACAFAKTHPVYLLRPIPELKIRVPNAMGRALLRGLHRHISISIDEYRERNQLALDAQDRAATRCGVKVLDPLPYLCHDGRCWGDRNGQPLYRDDNHLNSRGSDLLIPMFRAVERSADQRRFGGIAPDIVSPTMK